MKHERALMETVHKLAKKEPRERAWIINQLTHPQNRTLNEHWPLWRHEGQIEPIGEWLIWLLLAGRGFGKTRAGAEWVSHLARTNGDARIALVGATVDEVRKVMIEGRSGLLAVANTGETVEWTVTPGRVIFASGAEAFIYSGENPEKLRGPEHHFAWCDEIAKWRYPDDAWNNMQLGLRLGARPRTLVTTTPRPIRLLKRLIDEGAVTRGTTADNLNLPQTFVEKMARLYGGTRLGRQELDGELIEDFEGALWKRELIEQCRVRETPEIIRIVIGVDPPAGAGETSDACGIVAVGLGADGVGYVLGDHSVQGLSPEGWARAVADAYAQHHADKVVAEANNGGAMVKSVLQAADTGLPVKLVHARHGKAARAEPVAALYESKRAKHAGAFPELEDEMTALTVGGGYEGPGRSPDRADALVWAMTELLLGKTARIPRILRL